MEQKQLERKYYTTPDMCRYLGITRYTLRSWQKLADPIPSVKVNERTYFDINKVDKWLAERKDGVDQIRKWVSNNKETYSDLVTACKRESAFDREVNWIEIVSKAISEGAKIPVRYVDGLRENVMFEHPEIKFKEE